MTALRFATQTESGILDWLDDAPLIEMRPALQRAAQSLQEAGIDLGNRLWWRVEDAILITEAVNLAAKILDEDFYSLKPDCVRECVELGAAGGWRNGIFYLFHPEVGVASFHDPYDQIKVIGDWPYEWSGIRRQDQAFELLTDERLLNKYRFLTSPFLGERARAGIWINGPIGQLP